MNFGMTAAFPGERSTGSALRVVEYTGGSGTFTPLAANSWCRVTIVGGGGGGGRGATNGAAAGGGGGGATVIQFMRVASGTSLCRWSECGGRKRKQYIWRCWK